MKHRLLTWADNVAHFLYCPTMLGSRAARARWHHRIHLIPGFLLARACDALDRDLGVTEDEMYRTAPVRALACPDGCTHIELGLTGGTGGLTSGEGACGKPMRPANWTEAR